MTDRVSAPAVDLSIVVPLYNEEDNVRELHRQLLEVLDSLPLTYEIIFVDDGSTDDTVENARDLTPLKILRFRKNYGNTAAFDAGFKEAKGDIIITIDGDLQNDPRDIPHLLEKINEGYDVVAGWRAKRHDTLSKRITSRTANLLRKVFFKDSIHDSGCALKAYRKECFDNLDLFGEVHRFIPAILEARGFRVTEVKVNHRPRIHGKSKFDNLQRGTKSFVDMIGLWFWGRYSTRPLHLFGVTGLVIGFIGTVILLWMFVERAILGNDIAERIWPLIGVFFVIAGFQAIIFGLLSEIIVKIYYRTHNEMNYHIADRYVNA